MLLLLRKLLFCSATNCGSPKGKGADGRMDGQQPGQTACELNTDQQQGSRLPAPPAFPIHHCPPPSSLKKTTATSQGWRLMGNPGDGPHASPSVGTSTKCHCETISLPLSWRRSLESTCLLLFCCSCCDAVDVQFYLTTAGYRLFYTVEIFYNRLH